MPTERLAIDKLRHQADIWRNSNDQQADLRSVTISLTDARALIAAWDERNPDPPPYPTPV